MLRILVISYALRGHAAACLDIAEEMARRGHRVWFGVPEAGKAWIKAPGVEYLPWEPEGRAGTSLTELQLKARAAASQSRYWAEGQARVLDSMTATYGTVFSTASDLMRRLAPDLVVTTQMAVPVMDAAVTLEIPLAIRVVYLPASLRGGSGLLNLPGALTWWQRRQRDYWVLRLALAARRHERARRRHSACLPHAELFRRHTVLSITAPCIEGELPLPRSVHLLGPFRREPEALNGDTVRWLDAHREAGVVLAAFGSLAELSPSQVQALAAGFVAVERPVLWALPARLQTHLPPLPSRIRIEPFVRQTGVLAHPATRCFVGHAGGNSFIESMYWGRPLLAIPFMLDQPYFAQRGEQLGVGLRLSPHGLTGDAVASAIRRLLDEPSFAAAAAALAERLRATPGLSGAAEQLERIGRRQATRTDLATTEERV